MGRNGSIARCGLIALFLATPLACNNPLLVGTPGNQSPDAVSADARAAALREIEDLVNGLATDDPDADNAALAAALTARPDIAQVQVYLSSVLVRFQDDEILVILNNRQGDEGFRAVASKTRRPDDAGFGASAADGAAEVSSAPSVPAARGKSHAARIAIPSAPRAKLINAMGTAYFDSIPIIKPWLEASGYEAVLGEGSVEGFRTGIQGDGLVYISSHGTVLPAAFVPTWAGYVQTADANTPPPNGAIPSPSASTDHFILWTTDVITADSINVYRDEIRRGLISYAIASTNLLSGAPPKPAKATHERHFCVTEAFIRRYWRCAPGAFLYLDTCHSASKLVRDVCLGPQVGAAAYVGWTNKTHDEFSTPSVQFFFDRALGANEFAPIRTPRQRPFGLVPVMDAMRRVRRENLVSMDTSYEPKGLVRTDPGCAHAFPCGYDLTTEARLLLFTAAPGDGETLRPTIHRVEADEANDTLVVLGTFGDDGGDVTINGRPVDAILSWNTNEIRCQATRDVAGDVVVTTHGLASEPRRLSYWDFVFKYHYRDVKLGSIYYDATWNARVRADLAPQRALPDTDAGAGISQGMTTKDATLTYEAGGSYPLSETSADRIFWARNSDPPLRLLPMAGGSDPNAYSFSYRSEAGLDTVKLTLRPAVNIPNVIDSCLNGENCGEPFWSVAYSRPFGELPPFTWSPNANYIVPGGTLSSGDSGTFLEWAPAAIQNQPDPNGKR